MQFALKHWGKQVLLVLDQALNVFSTPFSADAWADETLSSRAFRRGARGSLVWFGFWKFFDFVLRPWGAEHCRKSYESELAQRQQPPEARNPAGVAPPTATP